MIGLEDVVGAVAVCCHAWQVYFACSHQFDAETLAFVVYQATIHAVGMVGLGNLEVVEVVEGETETLIVEDA